MIRRNLLIAVAGLLFVLLVGKCVAMFLGAAALEKYQVESRINFLPYGPVDATRRAQRLLNGVRYTPGNDEAWRELARFAYLLSDGTEQEIRESAAAVLSGIVPERQDPGSSHDPARLALLQLAVYAFDRAIAANALDGGSRFWRISAKSALAKERLDVRHDSVEENLSEMDKALLYDPMRPDRLLAAAEYAMNNGRFEKAVSYDRRALNLSLDGLENTVLGILYSPAGIESAIGIVPETAVAQERLSKILFDRWHFEEAAKAWEKSRRLVRLPIKTPPDGELAANGSFEDVPGAFYHDWQFIAVPCVNIERRSNQDQAWLRVSMNKGPANYFHVYQDIPVEPGERYHFRAMLQVEGFQPATTVGIELVHPLDPGFFSVGDQCSPMRGTGQNALKSCGGRFTLLEGDFTAPSDMPVVRFRLRRHSAPSETDSGQGVLELTGVSLQRAPAQVEEPQPDP